MSSLDGFWTYIVPGTQRGGLLAVKDGVVVGGDNIAFFEGVLSEAEGHVSGTLLVTRFNEHAELDGLREKATGNMRCCSPQFATDQQQPVPSSAPAFPTANSMFYSAIGVRRLESGAAVTRPR